MPASSWRDPVVLAFVVIPLGLALTFAYGSAAASRRIGEPERASGRSVVAAVGAGLWMIATWLVAESGVLREWNATPPPFGVLVLAIVLLAGLIAFGSYGQRLAVGVPLWTLVAVQGFRLPLELAMHAMYERGIMPEQMTYTGRNFDVVTGGSALIVAILLRAGWASRWLITLWNVIGLALLANVVTIAILSTPRLAYFGADRLNVWVTYPPFVWLPAVMVLAALAGHLVICRAVMMKSGAA